MWTPGQSLGLATSPSVQPLARMYRRRSTWAASSSLITMALYLRDPLAVGREGLNSASPEPHSEAGIRTLLDPSRLSPGL